MINNELIDTIYYNTTFKWQSTIILSICQLLLCYCSLVDGHYIVWQTDAMHRYHVTSRGFPFGLLLIHFRSADEKCDLLLLCYTFIIYFSFLYCFLITHQFILNSFEQQRARAGQCLYHHIKSYCIVINYLALLVY